MPQRGHMGWSSMWPRGAFLGSLVFSPWIFKECTPRSQRRVELWQREARGSKEVGKALNPKAAVTVNCCASFLFVCFIYFFNSSALDIQCYISLSCIAQRFDFSAHNAMLTADVTTTCHPAALLGYHSRYSLCCTFHPGDWFIPSPEKPLSLFLFP